MTPKLEFSMKERRAGRSTGERDSDCRWYGEMGSVSQELGFGRKVQKALGMSVEGKENTNPSSGPVESCLHLGRLQGTGRLRGGFKAPSLRT